MLMLTLACSSGGPNKNYRTRSSSSCK